MQCGTCHIAPTFVCTRSHARANKVLSPVLVLPRRERGIVRQRFDALYWHTRHIATLKLQVRPSRPTAAAISMYGECAPQL